MVTAMTDSERVAKLASTSASKTSGLLVLSTDSFQRYAEASVRSYSLFVFFTADPSLCEPCAGMQNAIATVARAYRDLPKRKQSRHPVFFAALKLNPQTDQPFLARYKLERVPLLYHVSPRTKMPRTLDGIDNYDVMNNGIGGNAIRRFVNSRVGSSLHVVRANEVIQFRATVNKYKPVIGLIGLLLASLVVRYNVYKHSMLWFCLIVAVYIFSVGGGHFSWIHDTPIYKINRDGIPEFIASGARSQFVAEGFFVSVTCVSISALIILIQEMNSWMPYKSMQGMVGLILVAAAYVAISLLLSLYYMKMPGYLQYNEI